MDATPLSDLLAGGRLGDAVAQATARVRSAPSDHAARTLLAELLCLQGEFDRAESQLAVVAQQTVDRPVAIARLRHLIRAAVAREAWFAEGAVPSLAEAPTPLQRLAIELAVATREGDASRAAALLEQAETARPKIAGVADGVAFDDWRDADDRCAWFLDILTQDGGYMWIDPATVAGLRFTPATRPVDLLWREARMALRDGRVAEIVVPAQYPGLGAAAAGGAEDVHRLAQQTDWRDLPGGAAAGIGQRLWLMGDEGRGLLDLAEVTFTASNASPGTARGAAPDAAPGSPAHQGSNAPSSLPASLQSAAAGVQGVGPDGAPGGQTSGEQAGGGQRGGGRTDGGQTGSGERGDTPGPDGPA